LSETTPAIVKVLSIFYTSLANTLFFSSVFWVTKLPTSRLVRSAWLLLSRLTFYLKFSRFFQTCILVVIVGYSAIYISLYQKLHFRLVDVKPFRFIDLQTFTLQKLYCFRNIEINLTNMNIWVFFIYLRPPDLRLSLFHFKNYIKLQLRLFLFFLFSLLELFFCV
jgi:hypothetical protein